MTASLLTFRTATLADREDIFHWRNHLTIRQCSRDLAEISWDDHCRWFENVVTNPNRILLIAALEQDTLGVLRYDLADQAALVSIYLVPEKIGQGYGARVLQAGTDWLQQQHPTITRLHAEILSQNTASLHAFEKAGYHCNRALSNSEVLVYEYHFR